MSIDTLPVHWIQVAVGDVAEYINGLAFKPSDWEQEGRPIIRIQNLTNPNAEFNYTRQEQDDRFLVREGTILVSWSATLDAFRWHGPEAVLNQHIFKVVPRDTIVDDGFLFWGLKNALSEMWRSPNTHGTTMRHINRGPFLAHQFPLPPLTEQRRLVEELDSYSTRLDAATTGLERVKRHLRRYCGSVLKAAVEGRLVSTEAELAKKAGSDYEPASVLLARVLRERRRRWEDSELSRMQANGNPPGNDAWKAKYREPAAIDIKRLPPLPEGWCWATVQMVGDVLLGRQRAPQYLTGRFEKPYLRVANIKDDRIDLGDVEAMDFDSEHLRKYRLASGDILVSEGQSPHLVGQSAIYRGEGPEDLCFQKTLHRFRPVSGGPSAEFSQLVFRSHVKSGVFKNLASITTNIAHLTLEKFETAPFPLPPVPEQERIVAEVARILSDAEATAAASVGNLKRVGHLRQSILKWAFEGKLVDQHLQTDSASIVLDRIRLGASAAIERKRFLRASTRRTA